MSGKTCICFGPPLPDCPIHAPDRDGDTEVLFEGHNQMVGPVEIHGFSGQALDDFGEIYGGIKRRKNQTDDEFRADINKALKGLNY